MYLLIVVKKGYWGWDGPPGFDSRFKTAEDALSAMLEFIELSKDRK